jgi:Lon protease-like protein
VVEPRLARLMREVDATAEDERWLGVVTLKPGLPRDALGRFAVFPEGTAARILDCEELPDGWHVVLHGEFRFAVERELDDGPHREALVRPVAEPWLNERDAGVQAVRGAILELLGTLSGELGERFPLSAAVAELGDCAFEELVNRIAADVDLPAVRKLELLAEALPERGLSILSILRSRQQVMDLLRPLRRLAGAAELN